MLYPGLKGKPFREGRLFCCTGTLEDEGCMSERVTVSEAADMLSVTPQRIQALIKSGDLESCKIGTSRMIDQQSVLDYRVRRSGAGRPKKVEHEPEGNLRDGGPLHLCHHNG